MACLLTGMTPAEAAAYDGVSVETRKTQATELRLRVGVSKSTDIQRVVGSILVRRVAETLVSLQRAKDQEFLDHMARYYPAGR